MGSRSRAAKLLVAHCAVGVGRDACSICGQLAPQTLPLSDSCLEIIEQGIPYIPTARPGSLFMV